MLLILPHSDYSLPEEFGCRRPTHGLGKAPMHRIPLSYNSHPFPSIQTVRVPTKTQSSSDKHEQIDHQDSPSIDANPTLNETIEPRGQKYMCRKRIYWTNIRSLQNKAWLIFSEDWLNQEWLLCPWIQSSAWELNPKYQLLWLGVGPWNRSEYDLRLYPNTVIVLCHCWYQCVDALLCGEDLHSRSA